MKKSSLLMCFLTLNTLNLFPMNYSTEIIATAAAIPVIANAAKYKENSYIAQLIQDSSKSLADTITSPETAKTALKYGTLALVGSYCLHHPEIVNQGLTLIRGGVTSTCTHINNGIDQSLSLCRSAYNNKANIAKATIFTAAILGANYLARGDKSLVSHVLNNGLAGIFPSMLAQTNAFVNYSFNLFKSC